MNRRLVSLAGAILLVAFAPGAAGAADPTEPCSGVADSLDGEEKAVVATTVAGTRTNGSEMVLYPGSRLSLTLCQADGEALRTAGGDLWDLGAHPAIANKSDGETHWTVTVDGADESAAFPALVRNQSQVVQGPSLRVQTGLRYDSQVTNGTLLFADGASRAAVERNESDFLAAMEAVGANTTTLNGTAIATGEPVDAGALERANETLSNITGATQAMTTRKQTTERLLYGQAASRIGNEDALTVIEAMNDEERAVRRDTRERLRAYAAAVDERRAALRDAARTNVLLGLVVGCLVGLVAGAVRPYLAYQEYDDFRATTSSGSYERQVVYAPVAVGLALVAIGIGLAAWTGALGVIA
ncbi:hypothetical protein HZS55_04240 [Halosimplex rubrum]|uniref:Uncharacterized protein n=1 Tax=Halosimplex rubrum TaxID=869889 RepID=A0A7D5P1B0_9EURY|nr:hypothetical protein [Halosimplex rubrum]QLH76561.1 hypothetical protein HZS55_04240 [Halosimplex rubrum]